MGGIAELAFSAPLELQNMTEETPVFRAYQDGN
jgi:hypothetical protein